MESIKAGFAFLALTKIIRQPAFHKLQIIERDLSKNVSTLETPLSLIGYAALIMLPLMYSQYVPIPFPVPSTPGPMPAHEIGTTAHKMSNATNTWRY